MNRNTDPRSLHGRALALGLLPAFVCLPALRADPPRLELNGVPAPVNVSVVEHEGELFVPASALLLLGWQVRWQDAQRSSLEAIDGTITVGLKAGADRAAVRLKGVDQVLQKPFQPAVVYAAGQLLLPLSVYERVLVVPVERDDAAGVVRLGETPASEAAKVRGWSLRLGLADPAPFHDGSGFRLRLAIPQGTRLTAGGDFLIAAWANDDACVQLFEMYEGRPPVPVMGRDRTGKLLLYPAANGVAAHWQAASAWRPLRWVLSVPPAGKVTYLAIATTAKRPPADLLELLPRNVPEAAPGEKQTDEASLRPAAPGHWAVEAIEVVAVQRD